MMANANEESSRARNPSDNSTYIIIRHIFVIRYIVIVYNVMRYVVIVYNVIRYIVIVYNVMRYIVIAYTVIR